MELTLRALDDGGLRIKPSKCFFRYSELTYFGHDQGHWGLDQESAVLNSKAFRTSTPTLAHYKEDGPSTIDTDASRLGLGAVPLQSDSERIKKHVAYASRHLSEPESRYHASDLSASR